METTLNSKPRSISVVVTTYNWPFALRAVLKGLLSQTDQDFEIIIADDGSKQETKFLIESMQKKTNIPIQHIWQKDQGFRAARIRNKAIIASASDYIIFLDGDCIPRPNFIAAHRNLAEPSFFVSGNRILLTRDFTVDILSSDEPIQCWSFFKWVQTWLKGQCNQAISLISFPLGFIRKLKPSRWKSVKGCNLGVWKSDLYRINGWDENFIGWGYEDSELAIRLISSGVKRKEGRFCVPVFHLWHPQTERKHESENWALLMTRIENKVLFSEKGLNQHFSINIKHHSDEQLKYLNFDTVIFHSPDNRLGHISSQPS